MWRLLPLSLLSFFPLFPSLVQCEYTAISRSLLQFTLSHPPFLLPPSSELSFPFLPSLLSFFPVIILSSFFPVSSSLPSFPSLQVIYSQGGQDVESGRWFLSRSSHSCHRHYQRIWTSQNIVLKISQLTKLIKLLLLRSLHVSAHYFSPSLF